MNQGTHQELFLQHYKATEKQLVLRSIFLSLEVPGRRPERKGSEFSELAPHNRVSVSSQSAGQSILSPLCEVPRWVEIWRRKQLDFLEGFSVSNTCVPACSGSVVLQGMNTVCSDWRKNLPPLITRSETAHRTVHILFLN